MHKMITVQERWARNWEKAKKSLNDLDLLHYNMNVFYQLEHIVAHLPRKYQWELLDVLEAYIFGGARFDSDNFKCLESDISEGTIYSFI